MSGGGCDQVAIGDPGFEGLQPMFVVARLEILHRIHAFDRMAKRIDRTQTAAQTCQRQGENAALPFFMEFRFVNFTLDRAEACQSAEVMDAVHHTRLLAI